VVCAVAIYVRDCGEAPGVGRVVGSVDVAADARVAAHDFHEVAAEVVVGGVGPVVEDLVDLEEVIAGLVAKDNADAVVVVVKNVDLGDVVRHGHVGDEGVAAPHESVAAAVGVRNLFQMTERSVAPVAADDIFFCCEGEAAQRVPGVDDDDAVADGAFANLKFAS